MQYISYSRQKYEGGHLNVHALIFLPTEHCGPPGRVFSFIFIDLFITNLAKLKKYIYLCTCTTEILFLIPGNEVGGVADWTKEPAEGGAIGNRTGSLQL